MMHLLRCPHCKNQMKYDPRKSVDRESRKQCVYCPKSFAVHDNIVSRA
jgi:uncharacterized protein YbaR (Trm112 family)